MVHAPLSSHPYLATACLHSFPPQSLPFLTRTGTFQPPSNISIRSTACLLGQLDSYELLPLQLPIGVISYIYNVVGSQIVPPWGLEWNTPRICCNRLESLAHGNEDNFQSHTSMSLRTILPVGPYSITCLSHNSSGLVTL